MAGTSPAAIPAAGAPPAATPGGYATQTNPAASELLAAVPTVGAYLRGVDADGLEHAGQTLVAQGIEAKLLADALKHALAALGRAVGVFVEVLIALRSLKLAHHAAGDKILVALAAREAQIFAAKHDRRAR